LEGRLIGRNHDLTGQFLMGSKIGGTEKKQEERGKRYSVKELQMNRSTTKV